MNFNTAKKILDYSFSQMDGYDGMTIELHGGEPFLNFSLIKKIDAYVMERYSHMAGAFSDNYERNSGSWRNSGLAQRTPGTLSGHAES